MHTHVVRLPVSDVAMLAHFPFCQHNLDHDNRVQNDAGEKLHDQVDRCYYNENNPQSPDIKKSRNVWSAGQSKERNF